MCCTRAGRRPDGSIGSQPDEDCSGRGSNCSPLLVLSSACLAIECRVWPSREWPGNLTPWHCGHGIVAMAPWSWHLACHVNRCGCMPVGHSHGGETQTKERERTSKNLSSTLTLDANEINFFQTNMGWGDTRMHISCFGELRVFGKRQHISFMLF